MMKNLLKAAVVALALVAAAPKADAVQVLAFSNNGTANQVTGTAIAGNTATHIVSTDVPITITVLENVGNGLSLGAFFDLDITSTGAASMVGPNVVQSFSGTLSINSLANGLGTNYLTVSFDNVVFGGGGSLVLTSSQPPGNVSFSSDVITSLGVTRSASLTFNGVNPGVAIIGTTLRSFTSQVTGDFNAEPTAVPEPSTMVLLGMGAVSLGGYVIRRRRVKA